MKIIAGYVAAVALCLAAGGPAAEQDAVGRLDGEYGLWVRRQGDSLAVSWITNRPVAGFLDVSTGGRVRLHTTTAPDSEHTVVFRDPGARPLTLHYGEAPDSAGGWWTTIRQDAGKPRVSWPAADSIYVVSDIHGEFDRLVRVLRNAGLVGDSLEWTGGRRQLVVVGDVFDRGADATRALWLLYQLEAQAESAGGRLHMVLGNHEIMIMLGDLRYVSPKEKEIARRHHIGYDRLYDPRLSVLGRWLITRPALLRIGDVLFAHGGVSTDYAAWTLDSYEDTLAAYTREDLFYRWTDSTYAVPLDSAAVERRNDFFWGPRSVFWYRDYAQGDSLRDALSAVLQRFDARLLVIGHTPLSTITPRYNGALIDVNTFPFVQEALLLVRNGKAWNRFRIRESGFPERLN